MPRDVIVVDYDPGWPRIFEELRARALGALDGIACRIEHVGSTSVPGLAAKPIIDMDVVVSATEPIQPVLARLGAIGYVHQGDLGVAGREAFHSPSSDPDHNLYVCVEGGSALRNHLSLRDHLRTHPEVARAYGELKKGLAPRFRHDIDGYVDGKTDFIVGVLERIGFSNDERDSIAKINKRPE